MMVRNGHGESRIKMNYSSYQLALFEFIADSTGNAVVEAVAGSGKTTTIVKALDHIKPSDTALFVAFNKHIAEELRRRVPLNTTASTLNSVGWAACRSNSVGVQLDASKNENILRTILDLKDEDERKLFYKIKGVVSKMVSLGKALLKNTVSLTLELDEIAGKYGVEFPEVKDHNLRDLIMQVWVTSTSNIRYMDFDDQIYMPVAQNWKLQQYPWVFGDEAQDWSPVQIELVKRLGLNGRIVAVGDRHQSIYGFRGADPDAIPNIIKSLNATVLPLSICYRCPDKVIAYASQIVPHIEAPEDNPKGDGVVQRVSTPEFLTRVSDGDFVLCRTTAPLVKRCLDMIKANKKAVVKGRDIGKGLIDLLAQLSPNSTTHVLDFIEKLQTYKAQRLEVLSKAGREIEALAIEDKCDTLEALTVDCRITKDIERKIDSIFSDEDSSGITFCSGHRSKGLEAHRIWILRPDLCPHPKAKDGWQRVQEDNLFYVMITRSMGELYIVEKEKDER